MIRLSPKETFLNDTKKADQFQELVMSPDFRHAIELAFCQFAMDTPPMEVTAAPQIAGAKRFIATLLNFGDKSFSNPKIEMPDLKPV